MEPFIFSELRRSIGLSLADMAMILGLEGVNAQDRMREMERGARPISGPLQRVLGYISQAVDIGDFAKASLHTRILPTWLDCADLEYDSSETGIVMHTRWPRFLGWSTEEIPEELVAVLHASSVPVVPMNPDLGLGYLVILFIDRPAGDTTELIAQAVRLKEAQVRRRLGTE